MKKIVVLMISILIIMIQSATFAQDIISYVVQAGYYKNKTLLEKDFKIMADKGLPVYKVAFDGGHRIYVGDYANKEEAEEMAKKVKDFGFEVLVRINQKANPSSEQGDTFEVRQDKEQPISQIDEKRTETKEPILITAVPDMEPDTVSVEPQEALKSTEHHKNSLDTVEAERGTTRGKMLILCLVMIGVMGSIGIMATIKRNR